MTAKVLECVLGRVQTHVHMYTYRLGRCHGNQTVVYYVAVEWGDRTMQTKPRSPKFSRLHRFRRPGARFFIRTRTKPAHRYHPRLPLTRHAGTVRIPIRPFSRIPIFYPYFYPSFVPLFPSITTDRPKLIFKGSQTTLHPLLYKRKPLRGRSNRYASTLTRSTISFTP